MDRKIAIQIQHDHRWEKMLELAAACGFRHVAMGFGSGDTMFRDDWQEQTEKTRAKLAELGLNCVMTHAPYYDLRISADFLDDAMETALRRCIQATAILGAEIMAIHPRGYYRDDNPVPENGFYQPTTKEIPEQSYRYNLQNLRPLVEEAVRCGCLIGVENLPAFPQWEMTMCSHDPELHKRLIDELGPDGVCGVWDFGHAHLSMTNTAQALSTFGSRIRGTHVHDNNREMDWHQPPMTGTIDWQAQMEAMAGNGYGGYLTMELAYESKEDVTEMFRTAYENCCKLDEMLRLAGG